MGLRRGDGQSLRTAQTDPHRLCGTESQAPGGGRTRLEGFAATLAAADRRKPEIEILNDKPGFYAGFYGTQTLLSRHANLDGIYYQDDEMAIGGLSYCRSRGLDVPGDIGLAGWGGMEAASILEKRLTTTAVSASGLGKIAAEALVSRIRNEPIGKVVEIQTRLIPGETC